MSNDPYPRDPLQAERDRIDFDLSQLEPLIRSAVRQRILENEDMRQHDAERRQADKERLRNSVRVTTSKDDTFYEDALWDSSTNSVCVWIYSNKRGPNNRLRRLALYAPGEWMRVEGPNAMDADFDLAEAANG